MKTELKILVKEEKIASNGKPYSKYKCSDNKWHPCFDSAVKLVLDKAVGTDQLVACNIEDNVIKWTEFISQKQVETVDMTKFAEGTLPVDKKSVSMYVSYAKDIFLSLEKNEHKSFDDLIRVMDCAITLVKQAKEAFEK